MAPNFTIYCLQALTDYLEFERVCHDLLLLEGYSKLEPLGGFSDAGRDAVHVDRAGKVTIFAYSVREDWRAKLAEDAKKICDHGHVCHEMVFVTTADISPGRRDEAVKIIEETYGWQLTLFDIERLRLLLEVKHPQVRRNHPQVFLPQFYSEVVAAPGLERNHLYVICSDDDAALAKWLALKLTAEGYRVWCRLIKTLGGINFPSDVDEAVRTQVFRTIALYSVKSLPQLELARERALALSLTKEPDQSVVAIDVDGVDKTTLDKLSQRLNFVSFHDSWATGIRDLLNYLNSLNAPKPLLNGRQVAAQVYVADKILTSDTEQIVASCLRIETLPNNILVYEARNKIPYDQVDEARKVWAFRGLGNGKYLCLSSPPDVLVRKHSLARVDNIPVNLDSVILGIEQINVVAELVRKSLQVKSRDLGLHFSPEANLFYFPQGLVENDHLRYLLPDGAKGYVNSVGERTYWRPQGSEPYRYHLAPVFDVTQRIVDPLTVTVKIRVHFADLSGNALNRRKLVSRRKHLCKDWWNREWLTRLVGVCRFFSADTSILMGDDDEQLRIAGYPLLIDAPVAINEEMLNDLDLDRSSLQTSRQDADSEAEDSSDE